MKFKIALGGNPNSGKTTLFNDLTGSNQFVGNWPGVTVEKKEGKIQNKYAGNDEITLIDLPGIYSTSPYTLEEVIARNFIVYEEPDVIINIVDGSNLERNLYLTTQLLGMGIPVVVAVNMMDVVRKNGDRLDQKKLSSLLGVPIVEISALKSENLEELISEAKAAAVTKKSPRFEGMSKDTQECITKIEPMIPDRVTEKFRLWYAEKLFENDQKVLDELSLDGAIIEKIDQIRKHYENSRNDDVESLIAGERYDKISAIIRESFKKGQTGRTTSDKIDQIVTNRWLALPIFFVVIGLVYYISITTVGSWVTDFTNKGLFGDGFDFFGREVPGIPLIVEKWMESAGTVNWLQDLILNGIIGGVGSVLGFVPQMFVLFFLLSFLEGCGYVARIAFILDRAFRKFGLSGKSFIPMLISTGCGVPGIMASRTIENENDRRMTVMTTTFMPCSAKLPVIALIAGALFNNAAWVAVSAYIIGILAILFSGIILKKTKRFAGNPTPFIIELPAYHLPTLRSLWTNTWERGWAFIKKAGTIILVSTIVIWFLSSYGFRENGFGAVEMKDSLLCAIGSGISWIFSPLGFGNWKAAVATIMGLVAKENVVSTMGVLYGMEEIAEDGQELWGVLSAAYTPLSAYSFLLFNMLCAPCFASIGAMKRELATWNWTFYAVGYMCLFAYAVSLTVYQLGTWLMTGSFTIGTLIAVFILLYGLYMLLRPKAQEGPTIAFEKASVQ